MKYSVCIDALYGGQPLRETIESVVSYGFDTIEFWGWGNKDIDELEKLIHEYNLTVSCMCTSAFVLNDPAGHDDFIEGLKKTAPVAKRLGVKKLITQVGMDVPSIPHFQQLFHIAEGLRRAVPVLEENDLILMIEPLNLLVDHKGYSLGSSPEAYALLKDVGSNHVMMLFDIYHQQINEGYVCANIARFIDKIGHFHTAGSNGRHELDDGELNYGYVFQKIAEAGYDGYIGLEFRPTRPDKGFPQLPKLP